MWDPRSPLLSLASDAVDLKCWIPIVPFFYVMLQRLLEMLIKTGSPVLQALYKYKWENWFHPKVSHLMIKCTCQMSGPLHVWSAERNSFEKVIWNLGTLISPSESWVHDHPPVLIIPCCQGACSWSRLQQARMVVIFGVWKVLLFRLALELC